MRLMQARKERSGLLPIRRRSPLRLGRAATSFWDSPLQRRVKTGKAKEVAEEAAEEAEVAEVVALTRRALLREEVMPRRLSRG